jgi:hypothetical protein
MIEGLTGKDLKESGRGLTRYSICLDRVKKIPKNLRTFSVSAQIQTDHHPNTSQERYRHTNPFGDTPSCDVINQPVKKFAAFYIQGYS